MKITAPRRRAINFSGNMAARASDANNRAIKRPPPLQRKKPNFRPFERKYRNLNTRPRIEPQTRLAQRDDPVTCI